MEAGENQVALKKQMRFDQYAELDLPETQPVVKPGDLTVLKKPSASSKGASLKIPAGAPPPVSDKRAPTEAEHLPEDWVVEERVRASGAAKGGTDKYYHSPDGSSFRTLKDAQKHSRIFE